MVEDISKKTIMVLVVLTIIVSALGTITVLGTASEIHSSPSMVDTTSNEGSTTDSGKIRLVVSKPSAPVTGKVVLNLV